MVMFNSYVKLPEGIYYTYELRSKWLKTTLVLQEFFVRDVHETL